MRLGAFLAFLGAACAAMGQSWMPTDPGPSHLEKTAQGYRLRNRAISLEWTRLAPQNGFVQSDEVYGRFRVLNAWAKSGLQFGVILWAHGPGGPVVHWGEYKPTPLHLPNAVGLEWTIDESKALRKRVRLILENGANYLRSEVTLTSTGLDSPPQEIKLLVQLRAEQARVVGTVPGSPIVVGDYFFGAENPMAVSKVKDGTAWSSVVRKLPIKAGQSVTYTAVIGVAPPGQMRRAFLNYLEHERPRPYQPFLHYNSWYDLGYFNRYTEAECLDRIKAFGEELTVKRGVKLSSFLFDDGWDDPNTVWEFTKAFSNGFVPMKELAAKYGAAPGAWLSPWGGYGTPRKERLAAGAKAGMEIDSEGYALSGPKYFDLFRRVTLDMVTRQGINQFKFDGTGSPNKQHPGSKFDSDFDAAIALIKDLRAARPGLFINLTTGTWPSPFWTRYADSIWRGGADHSFAGVGPDREKWITYRDGDTYHGVVQKGPLYPLNSLMLHGLIYARYADKLSTDPTGAFRHEVRSYFGSGTQLQEMYITPSLLSKQNWDDIAECAKWSQANVDVLRDTHWVGGDPLKLDVYGWAAWSPRKAILTLRNPSDKPQAFNLDMERVFELPEWRNMDFRPRFGGSNSFTVGDNYTQPIYLKPFEVCTFEGFASASQGVSIIDIFGYPHRQPVRGNDILVATVGPWSQLDPPKQIANLNVKLKRSGDSLTIEWPRLAELDSKVVVLECSPQAVTGSSWAIGDDYPNDLGSALRFLQYPNRRVFVAIDVSHNTSETTSLFAQAAREGGATLLVIDKENSLASQLSEALLDRRAEKQGWRVVSADSAQADEGPASNAIDGDPSTYWHTQYDPKLDKYPHQLIVDMGKGESVAGFRYLPRQDGGVNGRVKGYEFFLSNDGKLWEPFAKGELPNQLEASKVKLAKPVKARYFMFRALSEQNGEPYASAAEIDIIRGQ